MKKVQHGKVQQEKCTTEKMGNLKRVRYETSTARNECNTKKVQYKVSAT